MNFIAQDTTESDKLLFFGENEEFEIIEDHWIMAHIMHKAGIFPSISQAKKNGWNIPIPDGFNEFIVGKKKRQVFIFKERKENGLE